MQLINTKPLWEETINLGWCGFITREHELVGDAIAFAERWVKGLPFVHTFVIEDRQRQYGKLPSVSIIEATAKRGVARGDLNQYLGQKDIQCYLRQPIGWTQEIGRKIVTESQSHLGEKYGFSTIIADAIVNSYLGHGVDLLLRGGLDKSICALLTSKHRKICSQLVAVSLQSQLYLKLRGCLRQDADTITPALLGNDDRVFDSVIYKIA